MKQLIIILIFTLISMSFFPSFQSSLAFETEQEPEPPSIPQPAPGPDPIPVPQPQPAPNPFPGETESEKIQRLTKENEKLKQQNNNLQENIFILNNENIKLQNEIEDLKKLTMKQVEVIMDLVNKIKNIFIKNIFNHNISIVF